MSREEYLEEMMNYNLDRARKYELKGIRIEQDYYDRIHLSFKPHGKRPTLNLPMDVIADFWLESNVYYKAAFSLAQRFYGYATSYATALAAERAKRTSTSITH